MTNATKKLLFDIQDAGQSIVQFTSGKTQAEYVANRLLRRAVEREFEIIGEALNRLERLAPQAAQQIPELREVVDFRNRIVHGYDRVDDSVVWGVVQAFLPPLLARTSRMLEEPSLE